MQEKGNVTFELNIKEMYECIFSSIPHIMLYSALCIYTNWNVPYP